MNSPLVDARIRQIQSQAAVRREKREQASAKQAERQEAETRTSISPRDVERQAALKAAADYWLRIYEQDQLRDYHRERNAAIKEMARLYEEWQKPETSNARQAEILRQYSELYRKFENVETRKPTTTSDAAILKYWEGEKRKAALAKIYGATNATQ